MVNSVPQLCTQNHAPECRSQSDACEFERVCRGSPKPLAALSHWAKHSEVGGQWEDLKADRGDDEITSRDRGGSGRREGPGKEGGARARLGLACGKPPGMVVDARVKREGSEGSTERCGAVRAERDRQGRAEGGGSRSRG
ncbi:unnamed protein product [Lampetra planeri]